MITLPATSPWLAAVVVRCARGLRGCHDQCCWECLLLRNLHAKGAGGDSLHQDPTKLLLRRAGLSQE